MKNVKVSIIMPSLNVADYIEECLLSALKQTLQEIEILCIDAGSTDGTWEILQKYAELPIYKEKLRLIKSDQKSYGYQVNLGIRNAKGKYIAILETDDFVALEMYEGLYQLAEQNSVDFVKADYDAFFDSDNGKRVFQKNALWEHDKSFYNRTIDVNKIEYLYANDYNIWKGIYNREFLLKNDIWCNESKGAAFQDIGFSLQVLACAKSAFYTDRSYYRYRLGREQSSVNSINSLKFAYQEFYRLRNESRLWEKFTFLEGLYSRMITVFVTEYKKIIKVLGGKTDSEYVKPYYEWFCTELLAVFESNNIQCKIFNAAPQEKVLQILYRQEMFIEQFMEEEMKEDAFFEQIQNKTVYIFGAGKKGSSLVRRLISRYVVPYICDNSELLWGDTSLGVEVLSPQECINIYNKDDRDKIFIIANKYHYDTIKKQLISYQIPECKIWNVI